MDPDDETANPYTVPDEKPGEDALPSDEDEPQGVIIGGAVGGPPGVAIGETLEGRDPPATDDETTDDETADEGDKAVETREDRRLR